MIEHVKASVSVVILTLNEEKNLAYSLRSVVNWSDDIHVVDSGSTDRTVEIAERFGVQVHTNSWVNWAVQRNWALDNCRLRYPWVLFLDADEQLTSESRLEIMQRTTNAPESHKGFYLRMRFYFLGHRVRNGMRPHLRLIRSHGIRWFEKGAREYCTAPADSPAIRAEVIHCDHRGIGFCVEKLARCAKLDAEYLYESKKARHAVGCTRTVVGGFDANASESRWMKRDLLYRMCPPFTRSLLFFAHRLAMTVSIRHGWVAIVYAFFYGLWYSVLTDAMYIELCQRKAHDQGMEVGTSHD
jgi:glycosyltransferase involved in cell wall biosynthesis